MAEFVEFRAEEWISELEQMERLRLFDSKEIKSIATKRRDFEYKIQRKTKYKEDFLKYIQFEVDLHRIIKARREKTGINTNKSDIEFSQANRITRLFKQAIFRFQSDIKLWMSFFKFCEEVKFHALVSQMLVRMLQIHSNKPNLWIFAAKWEFEQCKSVDNARQFLTRALRYHPTSEILFTELFKLELELIKKKAKEKEEKIANNEWIPDDVTENIINGKIAEIVYESAVNSIRDVEFKVSLLNVTKNYKEAINVQNRIFQDILRTHSTEELTWDTMAKRELEGISCGLIPFQVKEEPMEGIETELESKSKALKGRIQRSIYVYERAVKHLNTVKMWSHYLDHVIDINNDNNILPVFKFELLKNAVEGALASGNMGEKYYIHWIEILRNTGGKNKKLAEVLKKGTEQHPTSLQLWYARLRFHLSRDQENAGTEVFNEAIEKLPNSVSLWKLIIQYFQMKSLPKVEEIFQDGVRRGGEVSKTLKPLYIEWLVLSKGIAHARAVFESPEFQHPPCLELYNKMAVLESIQADFCPTRVRKCHELACSNFGQNNPNVWLEYVKFEMKQGDISKVDQVHRRALNALEPQKADVFVSEYNFFKTGLST